MDLAISLLENTWMTEYPNSLHGWGNGYVLLPPEHPMYNVDYEDINVEVHGGLTYSATQAETGLWMLGFDTGHLDDNQTNCDKDYVREQTNLLRIQLEDMVK